MSNAPADPKRLALLAVAGFLGANLAFYLLSGSYFESHHQIVPGVGATSTFSAAQITSIRVSFAVFAGIIAATGFFAGLYARAVGHLIPLLLGAANLIGALVAFSRDATTVLWVTLIITGVLMPTLAWFSFRDRSRGAWAFLVAMCGVFAVVEFFGAPKVRGALDIGLWITMIAPGLNAVAVAALVSLRDEYLDRSPALA